MALFKRDNEYFDKNRQVIINIGDVEELAYEEFINEVEVPNIFIFSYDWRYSNGKKLQQFMDCLTRKLDLEDGVHFNFATHSLGSFLARNPMAYKELTELTRQFLVCILLRVHWTLFL